MTTISHVAHTTFGPVSAVGPQPRRRHADEVWVPTPTMPWGSRRLPQQLDAGDPRRTLFRSLLRRSEGVTVDFPDGTIGVVADVLLPVLGFDFWAEGLVVATPAGRHCVPVQHVGRIDVRSPRIMLS